MSGFSPGRSVIIDTDPGVDDAMAIALALASPELDVVALTTVFGNHHTPQTTRNALTIVEQLGRPHLPVIRGADGPIVRSFDRPATFVHGEDGLGDAGLRAPCGHAQPNIRGAEYLVREVLARRDQLTFVALGPLTNLALGVLLEPEFVAHVSEVVVMGGAALTPGNASPVAEANILADPESAEIVFNADWPVTMVGLDVTERVLIDDDWLDRLGAVDSAPARLVTTTVGPYRHFHGDLGGIHGHDAIAIAHLIDPDILELTPLALRVSTSGPADGETVVARPGVDAPGWSDAPIIDVATSVDSERFLALLFDRLS